MPEMDGYEASRQLRAWETAQNRPRVPIIALTAHAGDGAREKCLAAGMDDYLSKPLRRPELEAMLERYLGTAAEAESPPAAEAATVTAEKLWNRDAALAHLEGDEDLLGDMIALFLEDAPTRLTALQQGLETRNHEAIAESAHALKGMAGHFHAETLREQAAALERSARAGRIEPAAVAALTETTRRLMSALAQESEHAG